MEIATLLTMEYFGNSIYDYIISFGVFFTCVLMLWIFKFLGIQRFRKVAEKTKSAVDDMLIEMMNSIQWPFYVYLSLYIAVHFIAVPVRVREVLDTILMVIIIFYGMRIAQALVDFSAKKYMTTNRSDTSSVNLLSKIVKGAFWVIAVVLVLSSLGVNISGLVAGLGITGLAVAFALQRILEDIFASFSIHLDKPFVEGDFIDIGGEDKGTVKKIGIKTTRLRTLEGEELVVSNRELTETRVHNYKKMKTRRVVYSLSVAKDTPLAKLKKIPNIIREILSKHQEVEIERVHFKKMGEFAHVFEAVFTLPQSDYNLYLDIQQDIHLQILERFAKEKIQMPYPTQGIVIKRK